MVSIKAIATDCKTFLQELQIAIHNHVEQQLEAQLIRQLDDWLRRPPHQRRRKQHARLVQGHCQRCQSRQVKDFSRNGYRRRQVLTTFGVLHFGLPRVRCQCGGSVHLRFNLIRPHARLWEDVQHQVNQWAQLGLSLRQMSHQLGQHTQTAVGISTLNRLVRATPTPPDLPLTSVPPVVLLDAIWFTLLQDTGRKHTDACGRQQPVTQKVKSCVLVAVGIYPQTGRWGVLGWTVARSEGQAEWKQLLIKLDTRGVYRQRGLALLIHDGGSGLTAALKQIYPQIPQQRCLFHKLRNLHQAIVPPADLDPAQKKCFKSNLMRQLYPIFDADQLTQARQLTHAFCATYEASQPKLVSTLMQEWESNFAFLPVLARYPLWPKRYLRTTSLLERVNRSLRRLFRASGAFHSATGVQAAVWRVLGHQRLP